MICIMSVTISNKNPPNLSLLLPFPFWNLYNKGDFRDNNPRTFPHCFFFQSNASWTSQMSRILLPAFAYQTCWWGTSINIPVTDQWEWYIYLHLELICVVNLVGKYKYTIHGSYEMVKLYIGKYHLRLSIWLGKSIIKSSPLKKTWLRS